MNYVKKLLAVSVLSMVLLITPVASQDTPEGPPGWPMMMYGTIEIDGNLAPVGTIIAAYDENTCIGTTTTGIEGKYGDSLTNRLAVNEPSTGIIHIFVQSPGMSGSIEINEVINFQSGDVIELDLSADVTGGSSGPDLNNEGSIRGSSSSGMSYNTEPNNGEAMPGGSGVDTVSSQQTQSSQDTDLSLDPDDQSTDNKSKTPLLVVLLIGIIALIAIIYARSKNII